MTTVRNFTAQIVAAASALALSLVMIGGTVTVPHVAAPAAVSTLA